MVDVFGFSIAASWIWFGAGLLLVILELSTGSLFLLWPGVAALLFALVTWLAPGLGVEMQLFGFAFVAVALTIIGRNYFRLKPANMDSDRPLLNMRGAQLVGRTVQAVAPFEGGQGYVRLDDSQWFARADATAVISEGASLRIVSVEGSTLIVERV